MCQVACEVHAGGAVGLSSLADYALVAALVIIVPAVLARYVAGGNWLAVIASFAIWFVILCRFLAGSWSIDSTTTVWAIGFGMFSNWAAVPLIALCVHQGGKLFIKR